MLAVSFEYPGTIDGPLEALWGHLGLLLGPFWGLWGPSWGALGAHVGFKALRAYFGDHLGALREPQGSPKGTILGSFSKHFPINFWYQFLRPILDPGTPLKPTIFESFFGWNLRLETTARFPLTFDKWEERGS